MAPITHIASGKVREIYSIDDRRLLFVATDRISAYDVILSDPIPDKGKVLTGLSQFWFRHLGVPNHFLTDDLSGLELDDDLSGRAMVVRRAEVVPLECVVRGYLYGSSWREYRAGGGPTTEHLPDGLQMAERLTEPIFTPSTKATVGHDENLDEAGARRLVGDALYDELKRRSVEIYMQAAEHASARGVILADTKFEFGFEGDELLLVDEVLTPDSSRYWPASEWQPGSDPPSYDKQFVRAWLDQSGWDHNPPAPNLPGAVIAGTRARYIQAYEQITGNEFR